MLSIMAPQQHDIELNVVEQNMEGIRNIFTTNLQFFMGRGYLITRVILTFKCVLFA